MSDSLTLDLAGLTSTQVGELVALTRRYREDAARPVEPADESWREATSTGWTKEHLDLLKANLRQRGKTVQLAALNRAIDNGGFISRDEVYELGGYERTRRLNNWTAPINNFCGVLAEKHGLPEDSDWPIETEYGPGTGFRPAVGFTVAPELVKLARIG